MAELGQTDTVLLTGLQALDGGQAAAYHGPAGGGEVGEGLGVVHQVHHCGGRGAGGGLALSTVRVVVDRLAGDVTSHPVVADEEVLVAAGVAGLGPPLGPHLHLEPAAADVSGVAPQHLSHQHGPRLPAGGQTEAVQEAGLEGGDVAVPEVVDDLGEVDVLRQGPGHVLPHPGRVAELTGGPLGALLVEDLGVFLASVEDEGALVSPDLSNLGQLGVPLEGRQAGGRGGRHPQLAGLGLPP